MTATKFIINPDYVVQHHTDDLVVILQRAANECLCEHDRLTYVTIAQLVKNGKRDAAVTMYSNMDTSAREYLSKRVCGNLHAEVASYFKFTWLR